MSKSLFGQGKKPLDTFFWVNEITGEITYPPPKADVPEASPASLEKPQERPRSQHGSVQGAPLSSQGPSSTPAQKAALLRPPKASLKDTGSRYFLPSTATHGRAKAGPRSTPPFSAIPIPISPPGHAPPTCGPLGQVPLPPASSFPPSPSAPWAFTCKLKNVLTGNNRFSF
ncbi:uncharacterized protein C3orf86 homolog [Ailuropoda melanoleuca]|uniref:uncharacterized protein C3orf86 homolog n=1 Tax=Ailuropoda melanoleuca TaxID=9646 RepID=UPI00149421B3|nr:uncharacterized protein C3orf86 homolog [Ailuropoda melanoleuca]